MAIRLIQYIDTHGGVSVARVDDAGVAHHVVGAFSVYVLANQAINEGRDLASVVADYATGDIVDTAALYAEGRLLPPVTHPTDPAHVIVTGTGLTHLGSAEGRDKMHKDVGDPNKQTDSIKMFRMGLEGGKPEAGKIGAQPEWFYKGDGSIMVAPGAGLTSYPWALDGGEEPEIAGLYIIGEDGQPYRIGFAIGNEFSDHVTERGNYLWLAHSKLREAALGPEVLLGTLPQDVRGASRIIRNGETIWEKPFVSGEANMSHTIANLEHHHFKYPLFRRPGDVHIHFFGTATLSVSDGIQTQAGDIFEIDAAPFTLSVRNTLIVDTTPDELALVKEL